MKGKVFILEDDKSICGLIKVALELSDSSFAAFPTVAEFCAALEKETPDVALLDIMLPDGNGLDVLRTVKFRYPSVACIMLSAKGKEEDKVNGLNMGADDYISKPFSVLELTARVKVALRRKADQAATLRAGGVELNSETMRVTVDGREVGLNKKEFELLKYFISNAGKVLSREQLLTAVWGYETGETRTLDNHVARLRKLGVRITTVFGVGYKMTE